jgi:hypothetical protein
MMIRCPVRNRSVLLSLFWNDYTTVQLTTNGLLAIGSGYGSSAYSNYALSSTSIRNTIAPFWDDLVEEGYSTAHEANHYYQTVKLTASGEYVSPSSDEDCTLLFYCAVDE